MWVHIGNVREVLKEVIGQHLTKKYGAVPHQQNSTKTFMALEVNSSLQLKGLRIRVHLVHIFILSFGDPKKRN
jgi:hypothetical protein